MSCSRTQVNAVFLVRLLPTIPRSLESNTLPLSHHAPLNYAGLGFVMGVCNGIIISDERADNNGFEQEE